MVALLLTFSLPPTQFPLFYLRNG